MRRLVTVVAFIPCLASVPAAQAVVFGYKGPAVDGNSWTAFNFFVAADNPGDEFNFIAARIVVDNGAGPFQPVAFSNFRKGDPLAFDPNILPSEPSWSQVLNTSIVAAAEGNSIIHAGTPEALFWNFEFARDKDRAALGFELDFAVFDGNTLVGAARASFDDESGTASMFEFSATTWAPTRSELDALASSTANPVPVPGAVFLGMIGLGAVHRLCRRGRAA